MDSKSCDNITNFYFYYLERNATINFAKFMTLLYKDYKRNGNIKKIFFLVETVNL